MTEADSLKHKSSINFTRRYITILTVCSSILVLLIFWGFNQRSIRLIKEQVLHESRAFFQEIVQTRHWIIRNHGVYLKQPPSPADIDSMSKIPGLKMTITDRDGTVYHLQNHAIITDEISALGQQERLFKIRLLSERPLNPANGARDLYESRALKAFSRGEQERYRFEHLGTGYLFRYLAPLFVTGECLECHGIQGYKVGDVRGAIEVMIPAENVAREIFQNRIYTMVTAATILALLLAGVLVVSRKYLHDLTASERTLMVLATTDPLTGLLNRREGMHRFQQEVIRCDREGRKMSVMIIDLDRFKAVNDNHGHSAGDQALKACADTIIQGLREYDIICRYGGEEFLVVLPGNDLRGGQESGQRLLEMIHERAIRLEGGTSLHLTASIGLTAIKPGDNIDGLIKRADDALYKAKAGGRNQVYPLY